MIEISIRLSAITGSPSRCMTPGFWRMIVTCCAYIVLILLFRSICFVNNWIASGAMSSGVKGDRMVRSIRPSCILACGAIKALFPYWEALAHATRKAFSLIVWLSTNSSYGSRFITQILCHRIFYIGKRTAPFFLGKLLAYCRIEPHPAGAKENTVVSFAAVDC